MNEDGADIKEQLLIELENDIARYRKYRDWSTNLQWVALLLVTIAGFFTAAAGGIGTGVQNVAWYSSPNWLTTWGLIAAIGALITQNANPAQLAISFEKKKDAMRAIRTELKFRGLEVNMAAKLMEMARRDPEKAMDALASIQNG